ncbi:hypothetical protein BCM14_1763 [Jezberella montanilacus]|jgi:hypothetical protein|uniref:Uncharacterized protein n=1 Tax=Jezberella montanilacus TaxID=323426 RepID=A0A2T0XGH9_9BURK|nr:hypothetical protein [Jezberella montanilacus]PRY98046.1 hypothetical protein BCM14_1763 [Jezberella montanilacus]
MEIRLARLEAIIPSLATREDLACLETRMNASINRVESTLHSELTKQTWRIVALLAGLLPSLFAAAVYVTRYAN